MPNLNELLLDRGWSINIRRASATGAYIMKKLLTLSFILLGSEQSFAQSLPVFDLSYYDRPVCTETSRAKTKSAGVNVDDKTAKEIAKIFCDGFKEVELTSRDKLAKTWNEIPADIRLACLSFIYDAAFKAKTVVKTEQPVAAYGLLATCTDMELKRKFGIKP
jgi:hypothetical protein